MIPFVGVEAEFGSVGEAAFGDGKRFERAALGAQQSRLDMGSREARLARRVRRRAAIPSSLDEALGGLEPALLAVDEHGRERLAACPRACLELVCFGGAGERLLPAAQLDQDGDRSRAGRRRVSRGRRAGAPVPLDLVEQRERVGVLLELLELRAKVVGRPAPRRRAAAAAWARASAVSRRLRASMGRASYSRTMAFAGERLDQHLLERERLA